MYSPSIGPCTKTDHCPILGMKFQEGLHIKSNTKSWLATVSVLFLALTGCGGGGSSSSSHTSNPSTPPTTVTIESITVSPNFLRSVSASRNS